MTKGNTFHWIVKSFIYIVRDISSIMKFFRKGILPLIKWKFEYIRIDIFYNIIYNLLSKNRRYSYRRIFHLRIRLFTNLFNYRQSFVERRFFDIWLEIQLPFNSTFSSSHYCFFIPIGGKKKEKKNWWKRKKWILNKI